jgi:murein DD-endopeptidase MepM/ murein hydrolase activator NlpD
MLKSLKTCMALAMCMLSVLNPAAAQQDTPANPGPEPAQPGAPSPASAEPQPVTFTHTLAVADPIVNAAKRRRWTKLWARSEAAAAAYPLQLPIQGEVSRGYSFAPWHLGLDIMADRNTPVLAARTGVVLHAGWDRSGYGRMVWIDHGDGLRTLYAHLNQLLVKEGQTVTQGQLIALSGNTGNSTGPHLHFEVSLHDKKLDPLAFFVDVIHAPAPVVAKAAVGRDNTSQ